MIYRLRPYIYLVIGVIGLILGKDSKLALVSGLVLVGCGIAVIFMRKSYQEENQRLNIRHAQLSKEIEKKKF
jgi:hypothetical protein